MDNQSPKIDVDRTGDIVIVSLLDEEILEEHVINDIAEALFSVVMEHTPAKLVVSFARVKFMSSSALGMLIRLKKRVDEGGGSLKLSDIKANLYEVFVITKLNKLFDIYETETAAVGSFD